MEILAYGRILPLENLDKWITAIEELKKINRLVQEDIRDMKLLGNDEKYISNSNVALRKTKEGK